MSDTALMLLAVLELAGLVGLFALTRWQTRRRAAGKPRAPRAARIAIALFGLGVVLAFPIFMVTTIVNRGTRGERQREKLMQTGTAATATITRINETGTIINRRPEVRVALTVQPTNAPTFDAQSTWVFSVNDVQTYRVGTRVNVFFDPADRGTVAVVGVVPASP